MDTTFKAKLIRNRDIVTSIPKEIIRAAVRDVYNNPYDPKWPVPNFTSDDIIIVPSIVPKKVKKKLSREKA